MGGSSMTGGRKRSATAAMTGRTIISSGSIPCFRDVNSEGTTVSGQNSESMTVSVQPSRKICRYGGVGFVMLIVPFVMSIVPFVLLMGSYGDGGLKMSLNYRRKILTQNELKERAANAHRDGKVVVQCHGCFDIVHPGHIRYLEYARRQGDLLLVSMTGDSNVLKGDQRPYIPQELRAESMAALECVDWVYIDPNATAERVLEDVQPDVYVKGREYELQEDPRFLAERNVVERHGGKVIFSSGDVVFSSTEIVRSFNRDASLENHGLRAICDRHGVTQSSLRKMLDTFRHLRVLIVGDTVVDRYVFCDALNIASEAPMMSLKRLDERTYVGGAAIVARHIAALGAQASFVTAVGNDALSSEVEEVLRTEGVTPHLVRCRANVVEKTRFLVEEEKLLKVESAEVVPLDSLSQRRTASVLEDEASKADLVILCDFGFGMITGSLLQQVMPMLRKHVPIVTADVSGPRANLHSFHGADLLCPTERELRTSVNDFNQGLSHVAYRVMEKTQAKQLFVTLEKKGVVVFHRASDDPSSPEWAARLLSEHYPTFCNRPLDRLGGGDALLAAASLSLAAGADLMHAAYLGNTAAAIAISRVGNLPVEHGDVRRWLACRSELPIGEKCEKIAFPA